MGNGQCRDCSVGFVTETDNPDIVHSLSHVKMSINRAKIKDLTKERL